MAGTSLKALPGAPKVPSPGRACNRPTAPDRDRARLRQACERFEGLFLSYLFRVMRETIPKSGFLSGGLWQGMFDVFFDQAIGEKVAQRANLGIAEALEKQLSRGTETERNASATTHGLPARSAGGPEAAPDSKGFQRLDDIVSEVARTQGVDPDLLRAVIEVESGWNPGAVSPKGAIGLMQLMPDTARHVGIGDPFDPRQNVLGGARYLRQLLDDFEGDLTLALAAYNAGPAAVRRYGGIPPFRETERYVERVLERYQGLKRLAFLGATRRPSL